MEKPILQIMEPNPFSDEQRIVIHVNQTVVNNNSNSDSCMDCLKTYMCITIISRFLCVPCFVLGCLY